MIVFLTAKVADKPPPLLTDDLTPPIAKVSGAQRGVLSIRVSAANGLTALLCALSC